MEKSGRSKHGDTNQAETKTNSAKRQKTESEQTSRGIKRGWDVSMGTRVSVASCVWVSEGRLSETTGASGQRALLTG